MDPDSSATSSLTSEVGSDGTDSGSNGDLDSSSGEADGGLPTYDFSGSDRIFQDDDSVEELTADHLAFEVGQALRVRPVDETHIEITNFVPVDIDDAQILMSVEGGFVDVPILQLSRMPAHGVVTVLYPFADPSFAGGRYFDDAGVEIDLSPFAAGVEPVLVSFRFRGESPLLQKLARLERVEWELKLTDFNLDDVDRNWAANPTPADARLYTAMMLNLAYLWTEPDFIFSYYSEPILGNDGENYLSLAQKQADYSSMMGPRRLNLGVTSAVSGLGGGETFGVARYVLTHDFLYGAQDGTPYHEMGHVLGYGHGSSMTYPVDGYGFVPIGLSTASAVLLEGGFPVGQENYYRRDDHQIVCTQDDSCPWYMACTGAEFSDGTYSYCE